MRAVFLAALFSISAAKQLPNEVSGQTYESNTDLILYGSTLRDLDINDISQIILIAAVGRDFDVSCPTKGCRYLNHPESFKSSLYQLSFAANNAFESAHVNMDIIDRNMRSMPGEIRFSLITLLTGTPEEIQVILPKQLAGLERIAETSTRSANETVEIFDEVRKILEELIEGGKASEKEKGDRQEVLDLKIKETELREKVLRERQEEYARDREEIKEKLKDLEKDYDDAIDSIPSGWDILGLEFTEKLANTATNLLSIFTLKLDSFGGNPTGILDDQTTAKPDRDTINHVIRFPGCHLEGVAEENPKDIPYDKTMNGDYLTTVHNIYISTQYFEHYFESIFEKKGDTISLNPTAKKLTEDPRKSINKGKIQVETNSLPKEMKFNLIVFYDKVSQFMDTVEATTLDSSNEAIQALHAQGNNLAQSGACLHNWVRRLLDIPPQVSKKPFSSGSSESPASTSQKGVENAKYKVELHKQKLEAKEEQYLKNSEKLMEVTNNMTELISALATFNAEKASLQEVLTILQDALAALNDLKKEWLEIQLFFKILKNMVDEEVGHELDKYINQLESASAVASLKKKAYFLNEVYQYIQELNSYAYLIRKLSSTYLTISEEYILPPVRKLGSMLESRDESAMLRAEITKETRLATKEMRNLIQEQREDFSNTLAKRIEDLETAYKPIFDQIPLEKQKEIEMDVSNAIEEVPSSLHESPNYLLEGSYEQYLSDLE